MGLLTHYGVLPLEPQLAQVGHSGQVPRERRSHARGRGAKGVALLARLAAETVVADALCSLTRAVAVAVVGAGGHDHDRVARLSAPPRLAPARAVLARAVAVAVGGARLAERGRAAVRTPPAGVAHALSHAAQRAAGCAAPRVERREPAGVFAGSAFEPALREDPAGP